MYTRVWPVVEIKVEDPRDWAESTLFEIVQVDTIKELLNSGKIKLQEGEQRPITPKS
jgi:hypothetical protein